MGRIKGYIIVTCVIYPEDDQYVAVCTELETASCGDTIDEALKNIIEAVEVDLNALEQRGSRGQFFREHNIRIKHEPTKRQVSASRPVRPGELVTRQQISIPA